MRITQQIPALKQNKTGSDLFRHPNCAFVTDGAVKLHVQDYYHVTDVETEWALAEKLFADCLQCTASDRQNHMFLNYLSSYFGTIPDPVTPAKGMNARFTEYMNNAQKGCFGIVLFDFAEQEYCDALIATNF